jgi:hypothetical protein
MTGPAPEEFVTMQFFCTLCGNRSMRNARTGETSEGAFRVPREQADEMIAMIRGGTCIYCGGAVDVEVFDD